MEKQLTAAVIDPLSTGKDMVRYVAERGHPLVCVWSHTMPEALKNNEFDWKATIDHTDLSETVAKLKDLAVDKLIVGCETGVELHAALALALGLDDGNSSRLHAARRNKFLQSEAVRAAGLNAVRQELAETAGDVEVFIGNMDQSCKEAGTCFKAVVKPVDGGSSEGLSVCNSADDVRKAFRKLQGRTDMSVVAKAHGTTYDSLLCQEYLAGDEYVVDTVSCGGVHKVVAIWKYDKRDFHGTPAVYYGYVLESGSELHKQLTNYIRGVLGALRITDGAVHSEVMFTARGPVLVEANCRLHGCGGSWLPAARASIGYTQVSALYDATFDEKSFTMLPMTPPSPMLSHSAMVNIRSPQSGIITGLKEESLATIRALPSFRSECLAPCLARGKFVKQTVDANSLHGCFILSATDEQSLKEDYDVVQELVNEGLFDVDTCLGLVQKWKENLYKDGFLHLHPNDIRYWLRARGVSGEEQEKFKQVWEKLHQDPRVPQRFADQSRCAFTLDPNSTQDVSAEPEISQHVNVAWKLTSDDLIGDLAGVAGEYTSLDLATDHGCKWCQTPVVHALNLLMAKLIDCRTGSGCYSPPDCEQSNTFLMNMFAARTFCDAAKGISGDPSPEGVHTDGNALSVIMFMGRENVKPLTGTNRVFNSQMGLGKYDEAEFQRKGGLRDQHLLAEAQFDTPFETVILLDRVVKHEGQPFQQAELDRQAHRDVYLMFLRSPKLDGSDKIIL